MFPSPLNPLDVLGRVPLSWEKGAYLQTKLITAALATASGKTSFCSAVALQCCPEWVVGENKCMGV